MSERFAKTVILANGGFPTHEVSLTVLRTADRIVCCDGAADKLAALGVTPTWVVGDLDSLSDASRARFHDRLAHVPEQETNDLAKAFRFCLAHGWRSVVVLGATGLREDHTLANLSLLVDFAQTASVVALTDTGVFTPLLSSARLHANAGQQVSLFSFDSETAVFAEGLKYPVKGLRVKRWWQTALNEATGDAVLLTFEGGPLLVFQTYPSP